MKYTDDVNHMLGDHFGMFIHYGLYSVLGGEWKGKIATEHALGEWIMWSLRIPLAEYKRLTEEFIPDPDYAEKIVLAAKNAGMRYIVITTKHHDGFCLFKSEVDGYNSFDMCGRDLVEELAQACRRHGLKLGFYYSHTLDWAEKDAGGSLTSSGRTTAANGNTWDFPDEEGKNFDSYFSGKALTQVKELLTKYGDILLMWFDYAHNITERQATQLYQYVKALQPHCLVNSRIAHGCGDYYSLGDNMIPSVPLQVPQECLVTLNDTWGYKHMDHNWKTADDIIDMLARSASCGATLLMNVGPMGDGSLTSETLQIMDGIGNWVQANRDAVYETMSSPLRMTFDWGYVSKKGNQLFLYIKNQNEKSIALSGLMSRVQSISRLSDGAAAVFTQDAEGELSITLADGAAAFPVYRVCCASELCTADVPVQCGDTLRLEPFYAEKWTGDGEQSERVGFIVENDIYNPKNGKNGLAIHRAGITAHWKQNGEFLKWSAQFSRAGLYSIELITGVHQYRGGVSVSVDDRLQYTQTNVIREPQETGRYFLSKTGSDNIRLISACGKMYIREPGIYTVSLRRTVSSEFDLPLATLRFRRDND